jgi:hypothetical protein
MIVFKLDQHLDKKDIVMVRYETPKSNMKLETNTMYHLDITELIVVLVLVLVGAYERWTHVQPTFQRQKGVMPNIHPQKRTCDKRKRK